MLQARCGELDVTGALTIVSGATLDSFANDLTVGGDWTNGGVYTSGNNTVTFDGTSGVQTVITGGVTGDFDFNNVAVTNTGDWVQLSTNGIDIDGNLTLTGGALFLAGQDLTVSTTFSNDGGTLALHGEETVTLASGNDTDSGDVAFFGQGPGSYALAGLTSFYDVSFTDPGANTITWTMATPIDVARDLTIEDATATLDAAGLDISVGGNWTNSSGNFTSGANTVTFDGSSGTQTVTTGGTTTNKDFNDVVVNNTGTEVRLASNAIDIDGTLTVTAGTFATNSQSLTVVGAVSNDGTVKLIGDETTVSWTNDTDSGTVRYGGSGTYTELVAGDAYYALTFNDGTGGGQWTLDAALDVDGDLTITSTSTLVSGGYAMNVAGNFDKSSGATFTHGNNTVTLDGTGQYIADSATFYDLTKTVSSADTLYIVAGSTATVANDLTLTGANGALLSVEGFGGVGTVTVSGTSTVSFLSLKNITNGGTAILCDTGCVNLGENANWIIPADEVTEDGSGATITTTSTLIAPTSGSSFTAGDTATITWTAAAEDLDYIELSVSVDGGVTYSVIETNLANSGSYSWSVPNVGTLKAMLKVSVYDTSGAEVTSDESGRFSITEIDVEQLMEELGDLFQDLFGDLVETLFTEVLMMDLDGNEIALTAGSLFRGETLSGVYYVSPEGTRSVFPNLKTFESYDYSFDDVVMVEDDQLRKLDLGDRVTMAPGQLVKIQTDDRVFEIGSDGLLHHVTSEEMAISRYGDTWNQQITDIPDTFWGDYTIGDSL